LIYLLHLECFPFFVFLPSFWAGLVFVLFRLWDFEMISWYLFLIYFHQSRRVPFFVAWTITPVAPEEDL
tara:strand:- start:333 stop:539 length:207 start_codon:yes stop_codon:yes gene_type:complete